MSNSLIEARFVGADGSLGYRRGRTYRLMVMFDHSRYPVVIRRRNRSGWCPYSSFEAFRRNWEPCNEWSWSEALLDSVDA